MVSIPHGPNQENENTARRPRLLKTNEPVLITSTTMFYDGRNDVATYSGDAHLWQGVLEDTAPSGPAANRYISMDKRPYRQK